MNTKSTALVAYHSPLMVPQAELDEFKGRLLYTMIRPADFGEFTDEAAMATAMMALAYGLNPANDELWPIPKKGDGGKIIGFKVVAGYKGLLRAARDVAQFERKTDFMFGEAETMSPDEIKRRGADYCFRCNGKGCYKCDRKGHHDPTRVIGIRIPLVVFSKVHMATAAGVKFTPTWGVGIWQPGDNISEGRDAVWQATKRAKSDALRQEFDLPLFYGERPGTDAEPVPMPAITITNPNETELPPAIEAARLAGITYDDAPAFIEVVQDAITRLGYESEGHVMEALLAMRQTHLNTDDLKIADAALEHWLNQEQEIKVDEVEPDPKESFFKRVLAEIPYYTRANDITNALKGLGFRGYSKSKEADMFQKLQEHAHARANEEAKQAELKLAA